MNFEVEAVQIAERSVRLTTLARTCWPWSFERRGNQ
jgi:hypothetical protein